MLQKIRSWGIFPGPRFYLAVSLVDVLMMIPRPHHPILPSLSLQDSREDFLHTKNKIENGPVRKTLRDNLSRVKDEIFKPRRATRVRRDKVQLMFAATPTDNNHKFQFLSHSLSLSLSVSHHSLSL